MADSRSDYVECANPQCGHRKIHHHPRVGVCMASERGEFCPCDKYEAPVDRDEHPFDREIRAAANVERQSWARPLDALADAQ